MTTRTVAGAAPLDILSLSLAVAGHLPTRPGRTWRARSEEAVAFDGHQAVSLSDGHRSLLLAGALDGVALAAWPEAVHPVCFTVARGRAARPASLAALAVRQHLAHLDKLTADRMTTEERAAEAQAQLRDLRAAVGSRRVVRAQGHRVLVRGRESDLSVLVDPVRLESTLVAHQLRLPILERVLRKTVAPHSCSSSRPLGEQVRGGAARRLAAAFPVPDVSSVGDSAVLVWAGALATCRISVPAGAGGGDATAGRLGLTGGFDLVLSVLAALG